MADETLPTTIASTPEPMDFPVYEFAATKFFVREINGDAVPDATHLNPVFGDTGNTLVAPVNASSTRTFAVFTGQAPTEAELATKRPYAARTFPAEVTADVVVKALIHPSATVVK